MTLRNTLQALCIYGFEVIPLDILTEIYVSSELWKAIRQLDNNGELCIESIRLLSVKLMSDGSGKYILKLIE